MFGLTRRIRRHYDLLAPLYLALWGEHVHHGYWDDTADPAAPSEAQTRLVAELWRLAGEPRGASVVDVGCGFAGSLRWLARQTGARGVGLTISPVQARLARARNRQAGLAERLRVRVADAQRPWPIAAESADLVWCVECSEHLRDRSHLAREARRVLRPGGVLCLAAWLATPDDSPRSLDARRRVAAGMLCHPFETLDGYRAVCRVAGFPADRIVARTVTSHVARTWDVTIARRDRWPVRLLRPFLGSDARAFADSFDALRDAYRTGAMEYGLLVARTPRAGELDPV